MFFKKQRDIISEVKSLYPEILITADLAGFEQCTLTDNVFYNLLDCKLFHENLPNEKYLSKQLSISMFFFCAGNTYYEYLRKLYPHMPYLRELSGWQSRRNEKAADKNAAILYAVSLEVLRECGMSM